MMVLATFCFTHIFVMNLKQTRLCIQMLFAPSQKKELILP
jgi:hypothetical protein